MPAVAPFVRAYEVRHALDLPGAQAQGALVSPAHLLHGQPPGFRDRRRRHRGPLLHPRARLRAGARLRPRSRSARRDPLKRRRPPSAASSCFNDFSARDVQHAEMLSGFGPQKAKHFRNRHLERRRHRRRGPTALACAQRLACASTASSSPSRPPPTRAGRWARRIAHAVAIRAALPWRVLRLRHAPRRQRHRDRPPARGRRRDRDRHRPHRHAHEPHRRQRGRSMKVIDLSKPIQFNRGDPLLHAGEDPAQAPCAPPRLLVRLLGLPFAPVPARISSAGPTTPSPGWACTPPRTSMRPGTTARPSGGAPAQTIDQIPLERCIGPGVVLDMTHKADDDAITTADIEAALARTGATAWTRRTIVLIRTGRDRLIGTKAYWKTRHRHVGRRHRMAARPRRHRDGHRPVGLGPAVPRADRASRRPTNDDTLFWEAHRVGQRRPYLAHGAAHQPRRAAAQRLRGRRSSRCASSAPPPPPPASWR